jgi:hypothetical protein
VKGWSICIHTVRDRWCRTRRAGEFAVGSRGSVLLNLVEAFYFNNENIKVKMKMLELKLTRTYAASSMIMSYDIRIINAFTRC